jgi:acyl-coenzyme A synthetase/AMP-(fatty) acid ligase
MLLFFFSAANTWESPQCDSRAIRHLVVNTSSRMLLYSRRFANLAASVAQICSSEALPLHEKGDGEFADDWWPTPAFVDSSTVAYIHHTSGTTNGLPTPIPHSHASASSHLPFLIPQEPVSTLTTNPLYKGGIADLMRSLMSCSMIWLYPPIFPISVQNILQCIESANERIPGSPVKLFAATPYVLNLCIQDQACVTALRRMDMVGYGGSQLPDNIGNALVAHGVKLVSRFGSTGCGCEF